MAFRLEKGAGEKSKKRNEWKEEERMSTTTEKYTKNTKSIKFSPSTESGLGLLPNPLASERNIMYLNKHIM